MFNFLLQKKIRKFEKLIDKVKNFESALNHYSYNQLKEQTAILQKKYNTSQNLNELLPEAFATIKEAIKRATGLKLFDVQILGSIILHYGKIAEMKTGEGKTLVAIVTSYLNIFTKKGVHIITVNDYLAKRDYQLAYKIYNYLNITVGLVKPSQIYSERKKEYLCDITYITNSELGFDYLRDNMAVNLDMIVQRKFNFAIIDEVDSILIDEARTPLIISGPSNSVTDKYIKSTEIIHQLKKYIDYDIDEKIKSVNLTEKGVLHCEKLLKINNLYNINNSWIQYLLNALKAKELFLKDQHYIIKNNEIIIVDEFTGRIMQGRRWSDGLHQAIEAKEKIKIQQDNKTLASITYQNLFLLYNKLSGITGTAKTEETELDKIYKLEVVEIPTNKYCQRKDLSDLVYKTEYNKWQAIASECFDMYQIGRPTLIGTTNVKKSELLANILDELQIPYNLLNAKPENIARESEIITQAGRKFAITISTNMAGRGTDIILGGNAETMSRIVLINYIQIKLGFQKKYQLNKIEEVIKLILKKLNIKEVQKRIEKKNIEKIIEEAIATNNTNETIYNTYIQILEQYKLIFNQEKKEVLKLGGLYVIGTERHESRRIDNQLRGRSGRQGDQGSSRFFLSLEDNLLRIFGGNKISTLMQQLNLDEDIPIESVMLSKSLNSAQKKVESYFFDVRKQLFDYDEVINNQRQAMYTERRRILESNFTRDCIIEYGESTIDEMLFLYNKEINISNKYNLIEQIYKLLNLTEIFHTEQIIEMNEIQIKLFLYEQLRITYDLRESYLEQLRPGLIRQLEKYYLLQQIDKGWQEHLEKMSLLRESIGWRSYGQQDPLVEYKNEAFNLFINMVTYIRQTVIYLTMRSRLIINIKE